MAYALADGFVFVIALDVFIGDRMFERYANTTKKKKGFALPWDPVAHSRVDTPYAYVTGGFS